MRVLFVTRNNKTSKFIKWVTQILFTHQMSTPEQKNKLASDLLGISASITKKVLNTDANTLPCIYLFTIGYVKDLRESMNIDRKYGDNFIIAKYGFTKDLKRRTSEHMNNYRKIKNGDLKLKYYSYIDPQYISDGENDIKEFFGALNMNIDYDNTKKLVIINPKLMNLIKDQYTKISRKYAGHISELITKIKKMENEI